MKNIFNGHEVELDELEPHIRQKAIEIARDLCADDPNLTHDKLRKRAIKMAERWYYDLEG